MAATDEILAADHNTNRLSSKAPLLRGTREGGEQLCPIMPERLAKTDPFGLITPFRYIAAERTWSTSASMAMCRDPTAR
jgi:hypothetical protein